MKVKITVSGVVDLSPQDVKLLKRVGAAAVMDTLKQLAPDLAVKVESLREAQVAAKAARETAKIVKQVVKAAEEVTKKPEQLPTQTAGEEV